VSWKREGDRVTIELSVDDFMLLMLVCGIATAAVANRNGIVVRPSAILRLVNVMNEGNLSFTPYEIELEPE
jgi:hypothetical protein